jgi:hypothetical protein
MAIVTAFSDHSVQEMHNKNKNYKWQTGSALALLQVSFKNVSVDLILFGLIEFNKHFTSSLKNKLSRNDFD